MVMVPIVVLAQQEIISSRNIARGNLDSGYFVKIGLTPTHTRERDVFFQQSIALVCGPSKAGIKDDSRLVYCTKVDCFTSTYGILIIRNGLEVMDTSSLH